MKERDEAQVELQRLRDRKPEGYKVVEKKEGY
jgi:hypothetical protein